MARSTAIPVRALVLTAAVALVAAAAGCGMPTHVTGFDLCGVHVGVGAGIPAEERLGPVPDADRTLPQPATSTLPPKRATGSGGIDYVKLSDNCDTGAIVTVTPATAASLIEAPTADDGTIVAVVMRTNAPLTVKAWQKGNIVGELSLGGP
jgi:hypothetical protein